MADIRAQKRQKLMLTCPANEILYGGARGGGKSFATLMDWHRHRSKYGGDAHGILFRKTMPELEDMLLKARKLFPQTGGEFLVQAKTWQWADGSSLKFRYLERDTDADRYQGHEYNWMGFEEAGNWPNPGPIDTLRACFRSEAGVKHRMVLTANPGGVGHNWLKARYIDPCEPMNIRQTSEHWAVCYIPAKVTDNPMLLASDPGYIQRIRDAAGNEQMLKAWLDGSWDIVAGGMFDDVWNAQRHIIEPFAIPQSWRIDRAFDWGSSRPFSVGWYAESDGSVVDIGGGVMRNFPKGSVVRIGEFYGWNGKPNEGCRMLAVEIARKILEIEKTLGINGRVKSGVADSAIFTNENGNCIADDMARAGVRWEPADKSPGSRVNGWETCRKFLSASNQPVAEYPGFWTFSTCRHFIRTIPVLPRDERKPDDVDSNAEDHIADEWRYRLNSVKRTAVAKQLII